MKRAILIAVCAAAVAFGSVGCSSEPAGPSAIEQVNEKLREGVWVDAVEIAKQSGDKDAIARAETVRELYNAKEDLAQLAEAFDPTKNSHVYLHAMPGMASKKMSEILSDAERRSGILSALNPPEEFETIHRELVVNFELIRDTSAKQMAMLRKYSGVQDGALPVAEALALNETRDPELRALYEVVRSASSKLDSQFNASLKSL